MNQQKKNAVNEFDVFRKEIHMRNCSEVANSDFKKLYELIVLLMPEERQNHTLTSCSIFLEMAKKYKYTKNYVDVSLSPLIIDLIEIISVATETEFDNAGEAFLSFLTRLHKIAPTLNSSNKIVVIQKLLHEYNLFDDIISEVSWLFELRNEDCNFVFPIGELLVFIINEFEYDNNHLVLLLISLQIFSAVRDAINPSTEYNISPRILEIAEKYNIEILKCFCNGGKMVFNISNYVQNNVIAIKSNDKIVIRSKNKAYFTKVQESDIFSEKNTNGNEIAYYVVRKIETHERLSSFTEFMMLSSQQERRRLLESILDNRYYNVFIGKSIIMDSNNNTFINFTNPYSNSDEYIIYEKTIRDSVYENFFQILANNIENIRTTVIFGTHCDLVTLDFIIQFYLEIVKESNAKYISCLETCPKNDFYQNMIILNYFDDIIKNRSSQYVEDKLECFYQFIKSHLTYSEMKTDTLLEDKHKLVFPYTIAIPFGGEEKYWDYKKKQLFNEEGEKFYLADLICKKAIWEQSYWISEKDVSSWNFCELDRQPMDKKPDKNSMVIVDEASQTIYNLGEFKRTGAKLRQCKEIHNDSVLTYEQVRLYNNDEIEKIHKLINNVGLNDCNYKVFGCDKKDNYQVRRSIILYKLLWHFQIMRFDLTKVEKFIHLVLKLHYIDSAINEEIITAYFDNVEGEINKPGYLVIAKETSSNDGTLFAMFSRIRNIANRSWIGKAFEVNGIRGIKKDEQTGRYHYNGNEIKEICILTDLITKGNATIEMLDYYLNNYRRVGCPKKFLELDSETNNGIYDIIKTNEPIITVKAIFAYEIGINAIKERVREKSLKNQEVYKDITERVQGNDNIINRSCHHAEFEQSVNIMASEMISDSYVVNENVRNVVIELYGSGQTLKNGWCCVLRYVNMPQKTVFPEFAVKTEFVAGLFNRRGEVG